MRLTTMGMARNFDTKHRRHHYDRGTAARSTQHRDPLSLRGATPSMVKTYRGTEPFFAYEELKSAPGVPYVHRLRESDHLRDGDIVVLERNPVLFDHSTGPTSCIIICLSPSGATVIA